MQEAAWQSGETDCMQGNKQLSIHAGTRES